MTPLMWTMFGLLAAECVLFFLLGAMEYAIEEDD